MISVYKVFQVIARHEIFIISFFLAGFSLLSGITDIPNKLKVPADAFDKSKAAKLSDENVYIWSQISDTHFIDNVTEPALNFYKYDSEVLPVVNPKLIVLTGDIADSRGTKHPTQQKKSQWELYHNAVSRSKFYSKYLDVAGEQRTVNTILDMIDAESLRTNGRSTIMMGHHPLNNIGEHSLSRSILSKFKNSGLTYYLCGHIHATIYSRQHEGILELAASALRIGGYRVLAFDNDVLALTDTDLDVWPIGFLTFPKPARFMVQDESFPTLYNADQIRCLAFSKAGIKSVEAYIDGAKACDLHESNVTKSLFRCDYSYDGLKQKSLGYHKIEVLITDNDGNVKRINEKISFDGKLPKFTGGRVYAVTVRIPEIVFGFWLYFSVLYILLVVGSRVHKLAMDRWTPSNDSVNKVCGPTAAEWIDKVNHGEAKLEDYFGEESLSTPQKIEFGKMMNRDFIFVVVMFVLAHACPLLVLPRDEDCPVIFSWGTFSAKFIQNEMGYFLSLICLFFSLLPCTILLSSISGRAEKGTKERKIKATDCILIGVQAFSWFGEIFYVYLLMDIHAILASPMTLWIVVYLGYIVYRLTLFLVPQSNIKTTSSKRRKSKKSKEVNNSEAEEEEEEEVV